MVGRLATEGSDGEPGRTHLGYTLRPAWWGHAPDRAGILDTTHLISSFGLIGLLVVIFAETGLLLGFFLPGDSLLFAAGVLIAGGVFNVSLVTVAVLVPVVATAGSLCGYWIGREAGPPLFERENGRIFRRSHLRRAQEFFDRRGRFAVIAGRFVPVVRTFVTVVAGASRMDFETYAVFSAAVSIVWGAGLPIAGYLLGSVPVVADHVELFTLGIAVVSVVPVAVEFIRTRRHNRPTNSAPWRSSADTGWSTPRSPKDGAPGWVTGRSPRTTRCSPVRSR